MAQSLEVKMFLNLWNFNQGKRQIKTGEKIVNSIANKDIIPFIYKEHLQNQ